MIDEKLLTYPNVELHYRVHAQKGRMGCYDVISDVEDGKYGYRLKVGQRLYAMRYRGTNHNCRFHVVVKEITDEGILVEDYKETILMPWVCDLPNGGVVKPRKLYIEPCDCLFEKNSMEDILSDNIRKEECKWIGDKKIADPHGYGIWYSHGGWRCRVAYGDENLKNFENTGQQTLFNYGILATK